MPLFLLRWLLCLCVGSSALLPQLALADTPRPLHFSQAEFAWSDRGRVPASGWQMVALPHDSGAAPAAAQGIGWYRLRFTLATLPAEPLVLLVPRVVLSAQFVLNGSPVNAALEPHPQLERTGAQMHNWPQQLPLPPGLFHVGSNELLIGVQHHRLVNGSLSTVHLGQAADLRAAYWLIDIPQRRVPQVLAAWLGATLGFALLVWWRQRGRQQAHFATVVALWLLQMLLYLNPELPLSARGWTLAHLLLWVPFQWALLLLLWRFSGSPWAWFARLLRWASLGMLAVVLVDVAWQPSLSLLSLLLLGLMALRLLTTAMLLQWALREHTVRAWLLTGAELVWLAGPLQLLAVSLNWLPPEPFLLSPGSGLPLFLVLLLHFADRQVQAHDHALRERQDAIQAERQRLLLDMHDGIGSQLITTLRLSRQAEPDRAELSLGLERALADLRTIVDSLDAETHALLPLLGRLRERLEPQLSRLGLHLVWDLHELPHANELQPAEALQVLRLVQEAVNNVLQHAQASQVRVRVVPVAGGWQLGISDDGRGIGDGLGRAGGRGLPGMRQRAERLGGTLNVAAAEGGGTRITLQVPSRQPPPKHARCKRKRPPARSLALSLQHAC